MGRTSDNFDILVSTYPNIEFHANMDRISDGQSFKIGDRVKFSGSTKPWDDTIAGFDVYKHPKEGIIHRAAFRSVVTNYSFYNLEELILIQ